VRRIDTAALLVRAVPYGDADLVATFFTETDGKLAAIVRGARRSSKRFGGALEPMHELFVTLEDKGKELTTLKEARIQRARVGLTSRLDAMDAAGRALRWVRHLCPARTPEPAAWEALRALLDALDRLDATGEGRGEGGAEVPLALAVFGFRLLAAVGYGLDLERCARCGRACPEGRAAYVDAGAGGLVCSSCGGARRTMSGELRRVALRALAGPEADPGAQPDARATPEQANELLAILEDAMAAHTDFDAESRGRS
jgi:DNA repair protein RecO (recombination protein O)